jgi:hypothetical protein
VRKRVYAVYEQHKSEMDAISKKEKGDFSTVTTGLGILNEARTARAEGLADAGMSEDEYNYLVGQIYKTMWNSEIAKESGGKTPSEMVGQAYDQTAEQMAQSGAVADKLKGADQSKLTPEQREQMAATTKMLEEMQKNAGAAKQRATEEKERAKALDVPPQNIALFRKYEPEIKKYAMAGMEWMGL